MRFAARFGAGLGALLLAACATSPTTGTPAGGGEAAAAPNAAPLDVSYDWHGQMIMPFGTLLKESPIALHEVLLFHDDSQPTSEPGKDCYTVDGRPPRLVDHEPEEFLLCFSHDRLDRIEATVHLNDEDDVTVLARACSLWLNNPAPRTAGDSCEGRDGDIVFSAHLTRAVSEPVDRAGAPDAAGTPAMVLILSHADAYDPK